MASIAWADFRGRLATRFVGMSDGQRDDDLETLARMAARLAGRDPDEQVRIRLGEVTAFEGVVWRYPDFVHRAEAAYEVLAHPTRPGAALANRAAEDESGAETEVVARIRHH
jgi:hypothetical protein